METHHEQGIYIDLPFDEYLKDPAIGSSGVKKLLNNPPDFWWESSHNTIDPVVESKPSDAKRFGTALHKIILEGVDAYEAEYFPDIERPDDVLVTSEDLKGALRELDQKVTGKKDDLIERLLDADPKARVWDVMREDHISKAEGREIISSAWDAKLRLMASMIKNHRALEKAFTGGIPEVSVFWEEPCGACDYCLGGEPDHCEQPIRFRARFDYLKPQAIIDLKSFSNWKDREFNRAIMSDIANRGYNVQATLYLRARAKMKEFCEQGLVFGAGEEHKEWIDAISKVEEYTWLWIFYKTDGAPTARAVQFDRGTIIHGYSEQVINQAIALYSAYRARFGLENMWFRDDPILNPAAEDWPVWMVSD